jgi:beta-phosphoglucomutase
MRIETGSRAGSVTFVKVSRIQLAPGVALLFDLDGVIIDSMPMHTLAWEKYMERHGVNVADLAQRMHGARNDQIVERFFGRKLSPEEVFEHGAAKERLFREMMGPRIEEHLVAGIREFLAALDGAPMAIGSNAEPANIAFTLDGAGIRRYFRVIVDGQQVGRGKPNPDVYVRAAELLGVDPAACVVFEDSAPGVEAGLKAGAKVVGVATQARALSGVSLMVDNFRDPRLKPFLESIVPAAAKPAPEDPSCQNGRT